MRYDKWLSKNTSSLTGKTVAISGSTGGLGKHICRYLASLGARLILLDRNRERSEANKAALESEFPGVDVSLIRLDLVDINSVAEATERLKDIEPDFLIHNAGAYSIPRCVSNSGYDNVFTINFASPYYMVRELLPTLRKKQGRVVVVGSIAHNYSKINEADVDFAGVKQASKVYGNAKRYLMFSLYELFENESEATLAVTHPGITFTNITAHYPKIIFAIIKHPMKVIFMKAEKAALSIVKGLFDKTEYHTWYGPRVFDVWGLPSKKKLRTCSVDESLRIANIADKVYLDIKERTNTAVN
ncbi:MAG: SDR family NAD(P)-dependent oxidoreductase [Clostridia bacterium]|nr:SDR family NAD(P)-dependent oxidoreductase [Clostridia bacterium]